jgi:ABC-type phosphate transport system substrate-binding protein
MRNRSGGGVPLIFVAGLAFAVLVLAPRCAAQAEDVAVMVNASSQVSNLSLADLRKIFAGEKRTWPGGVPIKLIMRAPGCRARVVLLKLLQMSESEYKQYWAAQTLRGEADSEPFTSPSLGMALEAVKAFPGAISMVDAQDVKPGIKVIKLDGHMPGEPGYALH